MCKFQLKMNKDKTEFIIISSKGIERKFTSQSLNIKDSVIEPSRAVRNLGVTLDHHAAMDDHMQKLCCGAYLHLRNIRAFAEVPQSCIT